MSRQISIAVQTELDKPVSLTTRAIRFEMADGTAVGIIESDQSLDYDHGDAFGSVPYSAANGFDMSSIAAQTDYQVGNAEATALVADVVAGITAEMVEAGALDDATWTLFLLPLPSPGTGSATILDAGDVGKVKLRDGMVWMPEMLSYSMRFGQAVGSVFQRGCRAIFGLPRANPLGCGFDAEALWQDFTVTAVGAEPDRLFETDTVDTSGFGWFPGRLQWETGDNASPRLYATEAVDAASSVTEVTLGSTTPYAIQIGDTGRIRADCPKTVAACKARDNYINMNAEDNTPVGDATAGTAPGGNMPGGGGYVGELPPPSEE